MNDATGAGDGAGAPVAVMVLVAVVEPLALVAVSVTVKSPAAVKVWLGFCAVEVALPSPKFHDQLVGLPVDVSVNWTARGA